MSKNILFIAYYFPPDSSSGAFRPLHFARHLHNMGTNVSVLTAREQDYLSGHSKDEKLFQTIPKQVAIFRSRVYRPKELLIHFRNWLRCTFRQAGIIGNSSDNTMSSQVEKRDSFFQKIKDFITDFLSIPDTNVGWLPSALNKGLCIIRERHIDVIYATGGPWTCLLIGAILKKFTGKPLILDFRDPWVTNPYFLLRSPIIQSFETLLERKVIKIADHVIANTEELRQNFLQRYPELGDNMVTTIPNGFDEYIDMPLTKNKRLTFTHAGSLYFSRNPRFLLQAIVNLVDNKIIPKGDLRFVFLGSFHIEDPLLAPLLKHPTLQDIVELLPQVSYQEAVAYQSRSDVLLLIQPDFPLQVPRKLYEYLAFRKPILGITDAHGATATIIRDNQLGLVVENRTSELEQSLQIIYGQWKKGTLDADVRNLEKYEKFTNKHLTRELLNISDIIVNKRFS
ncbi:MAG: glycosyltransferase family 4 protein [Desulfobacteraceae bacterium]|nr:glycosyltransferase family 4 protein [Desulfobacteraceae bacterium]